MNTLPFSTSTDSELQDLLKEYQVALTVDEARKVTELLGRDPTVVEAVVWGIQGSEHCSYKSSRRFLKGFITDSDHVILGPVEDSGIVAITDGPEGKRWGFVITHESHNKPSQIVPFEGAATGVGGTVRDVVCMGARVIGAMDLLRLGDCQTDETKTIAKEVVRGIGGYGNPLGVPNLGGDTVFDSAYNDQCLVNALALGIVREDEVVHSYVPDEAGDRGYDIILVGKPTDRSGFGGASFASATLDDDEKDRNTGAVQEPNPFLERHLLASTYALFDWLASEGKLGKISCKDLGAGGVVCASVEQVADRGMGADVDLDKVHVALDDLPSAVIACAETQERLCFTCHPDLTEHILKHFNETWDLPSVAENARASVVGKVTKDDTFTLTHKGEVVLQAKSADITSGLYYEREIAERKYEGEEPVIRFEDTDTIIVSGPGSLLRSFGASDGQAGSGPEQGLADRTRTRTRFPIAEVFKALLQHPNGCSKEPIFKHFDKNVIGNSQIDAGEADAAVIAPLQDLQSYVHQGEHPGWDDLSEEDAWRGVAVAGDGNGRYGRISPYWQGVNATLESMRNVAAVGAAPRAITDCLNYGNPENPEELWELAEGVRGIAEAAKGCGDNGPGSGPGPDTSDSREVMPSPIPVISGNVSLYNGSIDPTAIVGCVGILPDARKAVTPHFKQAGSLLYMIGERRNECGGSLYYDVLEGLTGTKNDTLLGCNVPRPNIGEAHKQIQFVVHLLQSGDILSCHDISEGGLLMTLFEMTLPYRKVPSNIGCEVDIGPVCGDLRPDQVLLTETGGFVLEIMKENADSLENSASETGIEVHRIGETSLTPIFTILNDRETLVQEQCPDLHSIWATGLDKLLN